MRNHSEAPNPPHWTIGFNWLIDRPMTQKLVTAVAVAIEKGAKEVTLCLSSSGGAPDQALYAYEVLRALPVELTTHNVGEVYSAAMTLFLAGSKRLAVPNTRFLMHRTVSTVVPPHGSDDLAFAAESIAADDVAMMNIVAERTGKEPKAVRKWFEGQRLRDTDFALRENIIQKVQPVQIPKGGQFFQIAGG
jgi:ATP-dependent protease ClpP protease subunit